MIFWIIVIIIFIPVTILLPTSVFGRKNLPKNGGYIFACNHQSNWDAILIDIKLFNKYHYMCKNTLFKNKFNAFFLKKFGAYPVNRETNDINAVKHTLRLLKNNKKVGIFPQGTRFNNENVSEIKTGVILFSLKTKTPIIPARFVKKPRLFKFNKLVVGEPLKFYEYDDFIGEINKEILNKYAEILCNKINELN